MQPAIPEIIPASVIPYGTAVRAEICRYLNRMVFTVFWLNCTASFRTNSGSIRYLFMSGQDKILKKVGEEAAETIIASKNNNGKEVLYEMSDLWYHCLVLLAYHNINPAELLNELGGRRSKENNSKY